MTTEAPEPTEARELTADEQRIRGYLVDQAGKRDWIDLWPRATSRRTGRQAATSGARARSWNTC